MHYQCLIVDDEIELAKATCEYFQMFDVSCDWVSDAAGCERFLSENAVDILLLDINLEQESGFTLCKRIRETSNIPILFISARQSDDDILIALNIGGDDYIKKPYSLSILLAKVKVILRRTACASREAEICKSVAGGAAQLDCSINAEKSAGAGRTALSISLHPELMMVNVEGREVKLKAKEYKLLAYLFNNANRIISKDELFNGVWGNSYFSDGTLNVHIRKLREKIEINPNEPEIIETVWGTGYIFNL